MTVSGRKRILIFHHHDLLLRTTALFLERHGYKVATVGSIVQMVLTLEAQ